MIWSQRGDHQSLKQAVGIRSFPEADWMRGYGRGGQPRHPKEERSANRGEKSRRKHHQNLGRFINTAVPKFDGDGCWQQHLQIFNAIAKSNGWVDEAAALQLFAHLEGGGLNVARRTGADPATFATELEILAVRGFGDMGTCARNQMVWGRFIADQRSCGLRRHLDSVPPDTPIQEIVYRCWVWESHSEQKRGSSPGTDLGALRWSHRFRYLWLV